MTKKGGQTNSVKSSLVYYRTGLVRSAHNIIYDLHVSRERYCRARNCKGKYAHLGRMCSSNGTGHFSKASYKVIYQLPLRGRRDEFSQVRLYDLYKRRY